MNLNKLFFIFGRKFAGKIGFVEYCRGKRVGVTIAEVAGKIQFAVCQFVGQIVYKYYKFRRFRGVSRPFYADLLNGVRTFAQSPAVSDKSRVIPAKETVSDRTSRVVPAISVTIARSSPQRRL